MAKVVSFQPKPTALQTPSPAAIAAGHAMGADVAGLLHALKLSITETRHLVSQILALTPGDTRLRSLERKLCLFFGETALFAP